MCQKSEQSFLENKTMNLTIVHKFRHDLSMKYLICSGVPNISYGAVVTCIGILFVYYSVKLCLAKWRNFFKIKVTNSQFIFVTSSEDSLGRKLVEKLDEQGFSVIAGCETKQGIEKLQHHCSEKVVPVQFDMRNDASVEKACQFITHYLPYNTGLWAIVHNFDVVTAPSMFEWTTPTIIHDVVNVQLCQCLLLTRRLLPWLRRSHGRIVMTTTDGHVGFPTWLEHEVASGGIRAFCKFLRMELCKTGVSIHTVGVPILHSFDKSRELVRHRIRQLYDDLIPETQGYYGDRYADFLADQTFRRQQPPHSAILDLYVSAVTHAHPIEHYTSDRLRSRYDNFVDSLPRSVALWWYRKRLPVPEGIKWNKGLFEKS